MARPKKVQATEEPKIEVPETIIEQLEIENEDAPIEEKAENIPVTEKTQEAITPKEVIETFNETGMRFYTANGPELSKEQKIINFLNEREGEVKINDFLKSLFPIPKFNEPPVWLQQGESKQLRVLLEKMRLAGQLNIQGDRHMMLGSFYYPDSVTGKTHYHNLNTVQIVVKK